MATKKDKQFLAEARKMTPEQLKAEIEGSRAKLFTLRSQATTEKVEDISQFRKVRRNIARLLTEQKVRTAKAAK